MPRPLQLALALVLLVLGIPAVHAQSTELLYREKGTFRDARSIRITFADAEGNAEVDPDAFRADATNALREAYETGTSTLIE